MLFVRIDFILGYLGDFRRRGNPDCCVASYLHQNSLWHVITCHEQLHPYSK